MYLTVQSKRLIKVIKCSYFTSIFMFVWLCIYAENGLACYPGSAKKHSLFLSVCQPLQIFVVCFHWHMLHFELFTSEVRHRLATVSTLIHRKHPIIYFISTYCILIMLASGKKKQKNPKQAP